MNGPENGANDSSLWEPEAGPRYPTSARPQAGFESGAERSGGDGPRVPASGVVVAPSAATPSPLPALSILHEDEFELLKRIERLETLVANQEAVIAMCVTVATKAAEKAGRAA